METLLVSQLAVIETITAQVVQRQHLTEAEAEDFRSEVKLHLVDRDYEVLRRFQGRSSLRTYLTVVIQHLFLDYRNRLWGKWRPSADAKRLGATAIALERLIARDGWSFDQAVEILQTNHGIEESRETLHALYGKLVPCAAGRQFVPEEAAQDVASGALGPDAILIRVEHDFAARRVRAALARARHALTAEERLILKMRFDDGFQIKQVASALHLDQRHMYRTIERICERLRATLIADGLSRDDVSALLAEIGESRG